MSNTLSTASSPSSEDVMLPESIWDNSPLPAVRISDQRKIIAGNPAMMTLITNSMAFYPGKALMAWLGLTKMELLFEWCDAFLRGEQPRNLSLEVKDVSAPLVLIEAIQVGKDVVIRSLPYHEEPINSDQSEEATIFFKELRGSISHDLRAPVRQLRLFTQKILNYSQSELPEKLREEMVFLNDSSGELLLRFESLALLIENESRPVELSQVEISQLVKVASGTFSLHLQDTNGEIIVGQLPGVIADQELLLGIITEILNNAIDHIPAERHPKVSITTGESATGLVILFADNGIGFDNEVVPYVFASYSSVHESPEAGQSGPGMGLTIAKRAAERMGMVLTATGKKGHGATFALEIPRHLILT